MDYEKAFDTVQHVKPLEILRKHNLDERNIRIVANLCWHQKAKITVSEEVSNEI